MNDVEIPRYIDSLPQLFFWELDEAIVFVATFAVGIVLGGWYTILSMLLGYFVVKAFKRFKNGALDGILLHLLYWAGVASLNNIYKDAARRDFFY